MVFTSTRHTWNHNQLGKDMGGGGSSGAPKAHDVWTVPENEIFECTHVLRRKLVHWLGRASQVQLDEILDAIVRVSESEGSLVARPDEVRRRWAHILGASGRFQQHASRSASAATSASAGSKEAASSAALAGSTQQGATQAVERHDTLQIDVQVMQLTLTGAQPQALTDDVADMEDVEEIFGQVSMQACLTQRSSLRAVYMLVGRNHTLAHWSPDTKLPLMGAFREYYPDELFPSEKAWLPAVIEPVRLAYLTFPSPLQLFLPEEPLPADATVAYLVGKKPDVGGVWRELLVYRVRRVVHVYRIESRSRPTRLEPRASNHAHATHARLEPRARGSSVCV